MSMSPSPRIRRSVTAAAATLTGRSVPAGATVTGAYAGDTYDNPSPVSAS